MIKMGIINRKMLKEEFKKAEVKVGKNSMILFIELEEERIKRDIEKTVRNARISGRKTIKNNDFEQI